MTQCDKLAMKQYRKYSLSYENINTATLWIVATPIGNLEDMTPRAIEVLNKVDLVAVEDTRHSRTLLEHFGVNTQMLAYHEHNEEKLTPQLVDRLQKGESIALISDAGTPLISDPGYRLVKAAHEAGIKVSPVPGACALIAALSVSGLPTDRFTFAGFSPAKSAKRKQWLSDLKALGHSIVFYESCHRINKTLADICVALGEQQQLVIAREITKMFETIYQGTAAELLERVKKDTSMQKGELVVMLRGEEQKMNALELNALDLARKLSKEMPVSKAAKLAAEICDVSRKELYQALAIK